MIAEPAQGAGPVSGRPVRRAFDEEACDDDGRCLGETRGAMGRSIEAVALADGWEGPCPRSRSSTVLTISRRQDVGSSAKSSFAFLAIVSISDRVGWVAGHVTLTDRRRGMCCSPGASGRNTSDLAPEVVRPEAMEAGGESISAAAGGTKGFRPGLGDSDRSRTKVLWTAFAAAHQGQAGFDTRHDTPPARTASPKFSRSSPTPIPVSAYARRQSDHAPGPSRNSPTLTDVTVNLAAQ